MIGRSAKRAISGLFEPTPRADVDLLNRFVSEGDQLAFAALVRRHGPMVLATCRRMLGDEHEAEDAFQATFMVLARRGRFLRQTGSLGPWLYGVARRVARRSRQAATRRPTIVAEFPNDPESPESPDLVVARELRDVLDEEIGRLPEKYRAPVVLCYFQGQTYVQAAESLGCPHGTVSVRLARAREMLRDRLTRRGLTLSSGAIVAEEVAGTPGRLLEETVRVSVLSAASDALAGGMVADRLLTLTEGVLRAMWMTKMKSTVAVVATILLLGVGVGLGGRSGSTATAQPPAPVDPVTDFEREAKELAALRQQLAEREARLRELRQADAYEKIEAGIQQLREMSKSHPENGPVVDEFAEAFASLKKKLSGDVLQKFEIGRGEGTVLLGGLTEIHSDGKVIKVDVDRGVVVLDVGYDAGVKVGQVFRSYQPGRMNPDQTGWIEVLQVESAWSIGRITHEFGPRAPLRAGDIVQTDDKKPTKPLPRN